jgi:hypothetical protein
MTRDGVKTVKKSRVVLCFDLLSVPASKCSRNAWKMRSSLGYSTLNAHKKKTHKHDFDGVRKATAVREVDGTAVNHRWLQVIWGVNPYGAEGTRSSIFRLEGTPMTLPPPPIFRRVKLVVNGSSVTLGDGGQRDTTPLFGGWGTVSPLFDAKK